MAKKGSRKTNVKRRTKNDRDYDASPARRKARAARNRARRAAIKAGKARKGDGKDVHHSGKGGRGSTTVVASKTNRGKALGGGRPKGKKDSKKRKKRGGKR
jgi:hypothetical protein